MIPFPCTSLSCSFHSEWYLCCMFVLLFLLFKWFIPICTIVGTSQIFEAFGPVEVVQLPTDPETGHCKGFGFIQVSIT